MAGLPSEKSTASFWHSEPSEFLLGHRTTPNLPPTADVVIVGSGITGASAARFLSEDARAKDLSIVMLEAREACWGATGRNGGHCQPLLFDSTPDVAAFEVLNVNSIKSHIEQDSIPCEWRSLPGCRTFWTQPLADAALREVQHLKQTAPDLGNAVTFISDVDKLRELRVNGAPAATLTANAGSLWPYKYVAFILESLIKDEKLNLQTHAPVTSISSSSSSSKSRHELHTPRGSIAANHIILATNAYTPFLLPEFTSLIVPERGVMTALLPPKHTPRLSTSFGFVGANGSPASHDDYLNQRPLSSPSPSQPPEGAHLMFGGGASSATLPSLHCTDDSILDPGPVTYLQRALPQLLLLGGPNEHADADATTSSSNDHELEATHAWSGIWGTSRDRHPWVGEVPRRKGVWLAGGYSGHGMPNAGLCARAVVEMVLGAAVRREGEGETKGLPEGEMEKSDDVAEKLILTGDLPRAYMITSERMERARGMESVEAQYQKQRLAGGERLV